MDDNFKQILAEVLKQSREDTVKAFDGVVSKYFPAGGSEKSPAGEGEKKVEDKTKFKSFGDQALAVWKAATNQGWDARLKAPGSTTMNEAEDVAGGVLVQSDFMPGILQDIIETGIVASRCQQVPISAQSNMMTMYGVDETSRGNGSRFGGISSYWENEADQITPSRPKYRKMEARLRKLTGLARVTEEQLTDVANLDNWLRRAFKSEFGFRLDDAVINGLGSGQPLGIMNSPCLVSIAKETDQDAVTVVAKNVVKMYHTLPQSSRSKAVWLVNGEVEDVLPFLVIEGTSGGVFPLYMPPTGLRDTPYGTMLGRPVLSCEQAQALGTKGDIIIADFSQYGLFTKGSLDADFQTSMHFWFDTAEHAFRFILRVDGMPMRSSSITPFKGSKKLSPFGVLDTRA